MFRPNISAKILAFFHILLVHTKIILTLVFKKNMAICRRKMAKSEEGMSCVYRQSQILMDLSTEQEARTSGSLGDHWMSSTESVCPTNGRWSTTHVAEESAE
jgi:hypothetical protein